MLLHVAYAMPGRSRNPVWENLTAEGHSLVVVGSLPSMPPTGCIHLRFWTLGQDAGKRPDASPPAI
jgi:hypothetical protein